MEFADSEAFWEDLPNQWRKANFTAREARAAITASLQAAHQGTGAPPDAAEMARCIAAEAEADRLGDELAILVERAFLG